MATYTEHYNLLKPDEADFYSVADMNENMDAIDSLLAEGEQAAAEISEKIGSPTDTGSDTLFGRMSSGGSPIKSLQRVKYTIAPSTNSGSTAISPVDPEKCIVIMERLQDFFEVHIKLDYTLEAERMTFSHDSYSSNNLRTTLFGFWIIEFN